MKDLCRVAGAVVESLESRILLSGVPLAMSQQAVYDGLQLKIVGTPGNDSIIFKPSDSSGGIAVKADALPNGTFAGVSHILVPTKQKADELAARLTKGEDFAEVAKVESKDPGTAQVGGDLGCFTRDATVGGPEAVLLADGLHMRESE